MCNLCVYQMWKIKSYLFQSNTLIILKRGLKEELKFTHPISVSKYIFTE